MFHPLHELYRKCLLEGTVESPAGLLSIPDELLPPRISPEVCLTLREGGRGLIANAVKTGFVAPTEDWQILTACDLTWRTSWHGFPSGEGILVGAPELHRVTDAQWQAGNRILDESFGRAEWQGHDALFRLIRAIGGARFTLPCDLATWLAYLGSLLSAGVTPEGGEWRAGCLVTADSRRVPCPLLALPSITSVSLHRLAESGTPEGQARAALRAGQVWARRA